MEERDYETIKKSGGGAAVHDRYDLYAHADGRPRGGRGKPGAKGIKSDHIECRRRAEDSCL